ncbi:hypothetical protein B9479_001273 [Cryptococcus floricola]|uniref:Six-hairpin glycosidase n=1 Tax=Cryptococcus floricola TaxID=2591691 RepID=A0A5D3B4M2_9TREE|nr:hypothetical protein B9479_001273 [Cryptococcus floricola]
MRTFLVSALLPALLLSAATAHPHGLHQAAQHEKRQDDASPSSATSGSVPTGVALGVSLGLDDSSSTVTTSATSTTSTSDAVTTSYTPVSSLSFASVTAAPAITATSYTTLTNKIPDVLSRSNEIAVHSWELGTLINTLLEVYNPGLMPFGWDSGAVDDEEVPWNALEIARDTISHYDWTGAPNATTGQDISLYLDNSTTPQSHHSQALIGGDGALGDPVSLVPAVWLLAEYAQKDEVKSKLQLRDADDYAWAVGNQLDYLFNGPTSSNGTISQREASFELWADMGYMVSPSLAYLGLTTNSSDFLTKSLEQFTLESSALLETIHDVYLHILNWDASLWATGNGWMAYGLMRDLASVSSAGLDSAVGDYATNTKNTISGVFQGLFSQLDDDSLIPNYMHQSNATLAVGDTSGTALTVAAYYRFLKLAPELTNDNLTTLAEQAFDGVVAKIDDNGWVTHAVDPMGTYGWVVYPDDLTLHSPEAQAFAALMWKARTDYGQ